MHRWRISRPGNDRDLAHKCTMKRSATFYYSDAFFTLLLWRSTPTYCLQSFLRNLQITNVLFVPVGDNAKPWYWSSRGLLQWDGVGCNKNIEEREVINLRGHFVISRRQAGGFNDLPVISLQTELSHYDIFQIKSQVWHFQLFCYHFCYSGVDYMHPDLRNNYVSCL